MRNNTASNGRGVESFLARHGQNVIGVLSGFDRLRLQGTLRSLYRPDGMARFLERVGEPWKNFKAYVCELTGCIRSKAEDWAKRHGCQSLYLRSSSVRKEEVARAIISGEKIRQGPVAMMSAVEPCRSWVARGNRQTKQLELKLVSGKCLHLYFYILDPEKGLLHLRTHGLTACTGMNISVYGIFDQNPCRYIEVELNVDPPVAGRQSTKN